MGEIIFLGVIAMISAIMFIMTWNFPTSIIDKSGGASLFPRIVVILLFLFIAIQIIEIIRKKQLKKKFAFQEIFSGSRIIYIVTTFAYMMVISHLGYILSSICYLLFSIFYFHGKEFHESVSRRKSVMIALVNILLVVGLYFSFTRYLKILLPAGILGS